MKLNKLKIGEKGVVEKIDGAQARRLCDLGFCPAAMVTPLFRSPSKNPTAYFVRGAVIALRDADAAAVEVRLL